jgi:hypothetical protein
MRHRGRSPRRRTAGIVTALAAVGLVAAVAAYADASFSDPPGDANEAPDIASVTIEDPGAARVTVSVSFANFRALPPDSRVMLRFDLDEDEETGAEGDEIVVRYSSDGTLQFLRWDGSVLVPLPTTGMSATFSDGVLAYTIERQLLGGATSFGLVAVATRSQQAGAGVVTATDFAPADGRHVFAAPGTVSYPDPDGDHDVAPDITSIAVVDTSDGTITFRLTTANYTTLPPDKLIGIGIDLAGRPDRDDGLFLGYLSGSRTVEVDREEDGILAPAEPPFRVSGSHEEGVLTFSVHRSELDGAAAFGFGVVSADLVGPGESEGQEFEGEVEALDSAPDDLSALFSYRLANPGPVRLRAGAVSGSRAPRAGRPFTVGVMVRRLDTYRVVRSGAVTCRASVGGKRVRASGRFRGSRAECKLQIPARRSASVLRGTIAVRVGGASHRSTFRYVVR